jgi:peptide/nickel transport system substrate-binding protein
VPSTSTHESPHHRRIGLAAVVTVAALLIAACGGDNSSSGGSATTSGAPASTAAGTTGSGGSQAGTTASAGTKDGGQLTVAIGTEPQSLDPDQLRAGTDLYTTVNIFEQLLSRDVKGNLVPALAKSWAVSPDGLQYTFTLRSDVKFQNGDPMTAEDVKFSFERFKDPNLGNIYAFLLANMTAVDVLAPDQVRVTMSQHDGAFLSALGYTYIVPMKYIQQVGDKQFNEAPIGTGPWTYKSRQIKQSLDFARNDSYWGDKPGYSALQFRIIPDDNARVSALKAGEVDMIAQVPPQTVPTLQKDSNLSLKQALGGEVIYVGWNTVDPSLPVANPKVRQALAMAVDTKTLRETVLGGLGVLMSGLSPLDVGWDPAAVKQQPYDPDGAKKMLADAGFANGFSMDFVAPVNGRLPNSQQVAQALAGFWEAVGVHTNVQLIAYGQWVDAEKTGSKLSGAVFGLNGDSLTFDPQRRLVDTLSCKGNYSHVCDPALDQMINQIKTTTDQAARTDLNKKAFDYVNANTLVTNLYNTESAFAMKKTVNWEPWYGSSFTRMGNATPA